MFQYVERISQILEEVFEEETEKIDESVSLIVDATKNKNSIFIFGASHAGILSQELFYRAGGLVTINPIFGKELMLDRSPISITSQMERLEGYGTIIGKSVPFKKDDVLILHSVSGRNSVIIDLALYAKSKGVRMIGLTNLSYSKAVYSRHSSGKRLFELSDIVIDNHGDIGDACCTVPRLEQKVGASSTVVGAVILNTIVVEAVKKLINNGIDQPPVLYSSNLDGGDELNKSIFLEYKDSIHYNFL